MSAPKLTEAQRKRVTCKGRGSYVALDFGEYDEVLRAYTCGTCKGSGRVVATEAGRKAVSR